ncbi:MAG: PAS domain-containing protein [Deltaproteobacteria bacterium]|nr:PAS domain-containing protein [Deltaproteobacteria bacterium]
MIRYSARVEKIEPIDCQFTLDNPSDGGIAALRRRLLRLALDEEDPVQVVESAVETVSAALGCSCTFIEGCIVSETSPGCITLPVHAEGNRVGALLVADRLNALSEFEKDDVQEIADLIGLFAIQAGQARAILELENDSEDMFFHAPDAIFVVTADARVRLANHRALEFVKMEGSQVEGQPLADILGAVIPDSKAIKELSDSGEPIEVEIESPMGSRLASLTFSIVDGDDREQFLCVARDITQERQAQLALRRSERSNLMIKAAEYLLHEVNNPLAALLANVKNARKYMDKLNVEAQEIQFDVENGNSAASKDAVRRLVDGSERIEQALTGIGSSGGRIHDTMKTLRSSHKDGNDAGPESVDVGFELGLAIRAAEQEIEGCSTITKDVAPLPRIVAVPLHIAEALGAIIKNAVQVVQDETEKQVTVRADEVDNQVRIVVEDSGPGVPEELRQRIFMPFFTTKPLGEALGLGLTMADDTIGRMGGSISVSSSEHGGARFVVCLPVNKAE